MHNTIAYHTLTQKCDDRGCHAFVFYFIFEFSFIVHRLLLPSTTCCALGSFIVHFNFSSNNVLSTVGFAEPLLTFIPCPIKN